MTDHSTTHVQIERLIATMTDQLTTLTRTLGASVKSFTGVTGGTHTENWSKRCA
jgi:hypothetical protein